MRREPPLCELGNGVPANFSDPYLRMDTELTAVFVV